MRASAGAGAAEAGLAGGRAGVAGGVEHDAGATDARSNRLALLGQDPLDELAQVVVRSSFWHLLLAVHVITNPNPHGSSNRLCRSHDSCQERVKMRASAQLPSDSTASCLAAL